MGGIVNNDTYKNYKVKMGTKKLSELDGEIISLKDRPQKNDCLCFVCPICESGHSILVSWLGPSLVLDGSIWEKTGNNINNITITPSIDCSKPNEDGSQSSCKFHGWVKEGYVTW